eukprot:tig00000615_g2544.t1
MAGPGSAGKDAAGKAGQEPRPAPRAVDVDAGSDPDPPAQGKRSDSRFSFFGGITGKFRNLAAMMHIPGAVASIKDRAGLERLSKERMEQLKISSRLRRTDLAKLWYYFQRIDRDKFDYITSEQLKEFPPIGLNPLCSRIITCLEFHDPGKITFEEFCVALSVFSARFNTEKKTRFAFKIYDIDQDGKIGTSDLTNIFTLTLTSPDGTRALSDQEFEEVIKRTLAEADSDGDGFISYEDFAKVVTGTDFKSRMTFNL